MELEASHTKSPAAVRGFCCSRSISRALLLGCQGGICKAAVSGMERKGADLAGEGERGGELVVGFEN